MSITISPERARYNQIIKDFIKLIPKGGLVYDIGKSSIHDYRQDFNGFCYKTIDRDDTKYPDIVMDLELCVPSGNHKADAILCNGVIEQCVNPYCLVRGVSFLIKKRAPVLMGMISIGYPMYENDRVRFTPFGAAEMLKNMGFDIEDVAIVGRGKIPSYIFITCRKN